MEDRDDWKLGDDGDASACPHCGKRNRPGLPHCIICGNPLAGLVETDPGSLRTLGEAMGGERRPRRVPARPGLRTWSIAATVLLLVVAVLTWLQTREDPYRLEDWLAPVGTPRPSAVPTAVATPVVTATLRRAPTVVPTAEPPAPTAVPPTVLPTVARPAPTVPRPAATVRVVVPPRPRPTRTARPPAPRTAPPPVTREPVTEPADQPTPVDRPRVDATEKPSLGTDLQDASRAYRQAVDLHNERVDEYNALADEVQRRNAWDDSEGSVELRRRLERARAAVESARVQAEMARTRMESVRARYR